MPWDDRWMQLSTVVAGWSKDRSTKVGAVIVDDRNVVVSLGWNGFPRGVRDEVEERHERPAKYLWTEHAERNAIYNAAANGLATRGCRLYMPWFPCAACARAIIQAGLSGVVVQKVKRMDDRWDKDMRVASEMLMEAGVEVSVWERAVELEEPKARPERRQGLAERRQGFDLHNRHLRRNGPLGDDRRKSQPLSDLEGATAGCFP